MHTLIRFDKIAHRAQQIRLTLSALASAANLSPSTVSKLHNRRVSDVRLSTLERLDGALSAEETRLFDYLAKLPHLADRDGDGGDQGDGR